MSQTIFSGADSYRKLAEILHEQGAKKILLVCGSSFKHLSIKDFIESMNVEIIRFSDFAPNPLYDDVCKGVTLFNSEKCDAILAIGGGSAIDVAKCIKLYCKMDPSVNYLKQECFDSGIPLLTLPTTAGTGSESTRFAVIYFEGKKQSVTHQSIIPDYVILEPAVLKCLPVYQKKSTMLDALCQAIESWWSINSTEESKDYSKIAVKMIIENWKQYINDNTDVAAEKIMLAANYAGRAINITQTTAAHALSYKLTSIYNLPHGHAVAVSLPEVWDYMNNHTSDCIDSRGPDYLKGIFSDISEALCCSNRVEAVVGFRKFLLELEMEYPTASDREAELKLLTESVNPIRLKNNPVALDSMTVRSLYERILK